MKILVIAKREGAFLQRLDSDRGRVVVPSDLYVGPIHSIASILLRGYWIEFEVPIEIEVTNKLKDLLKKRNNQGSQELVNANR